MRRPLPHPAPDECGFILVGVVTFMLSLTILGLSLFALSSYEGQFFAASAAREQSLQSAESGMELVQALLAAPGSRLDAAHRAEGQFGIKSAMAYQRRSASWTDTSSSGPVNWDSTVVIVVSARRGGIERTLLASFLPTPAQNPYQRLLATGQGITCTTSNASALQITGRIWQPVASAADTSWTGDVAWNAGRPVQCGTPPLIKADQFVDAHALALTVVDPSSASDFGNNSSYRLTLTGPTSSASSPTFFTSPSTKPNKAGEDQLPMAGDYEFIIGRDLTIEVDGLAVWVAPGGIYFKDRVTVVPKNIGIPSTLVIVAKRGIDTNHPNRAIWFDGALQVPGSNVHVFLVSQEDISIVHHNDASQNNDALTVSVAAGGWIEIGAPQSGKVFRFGRDPVMDTIAEQLLVQGALPPLAGATQAQFALARPSWAEITPR